MITDSQNRRLAGVSTVTLEAMTAEVSRPAGPLLDGRIVRLSGTELCPRWRGWIHLVAFVAAIPAAAALLSRRPSFAVGLYSLGLLAMFGASSAYHLLPLPDRARRTMRQVDHVTIYLFIAACYTPFCWLALPRDLGTPLLALAWLGAALGAVMKVVGFDRAQRAGAVLYLVVGCLAVIAAPAGLRALDGSELVLLAATGTCYAAGTVVLYTRRPDPVPDRFGYHEVWHSAVVLASACFYLLVWDLAR
jgi:hemolysin III